MQHNLRTGSQFLATMERMARQKLHKKGATILEIIVPVFFCIIVLALSYAFTSETHRYHNYFDFLGVSTQPYLYPFYVCYGPDGDPIPGLLVCNETDPNITYECSTSDRVPFKNFCIDSEIGFFGYTYYFVNNVQAQAASLLNLDNIIIGQWCMASAGRGASSYAAVVGAMSSIGLGTSAYTRYNSVRNSGKLYFAPAANVPSALIDYLNSTSAYFTYVYGGTFDTVDEAEAFVKGKTAYNWGIVVINDITKGFDVEIRLNQTSLPKTDTIVFTDYSGAYHYDSIDMYYVSGFLTLQKLLYGYAFSQAKVNGIVSSAYEPVLNLPIVASMGEAPYKRSTMVEVSGPVMPFILILSYIYTFTQMVQQLVRDKELRIREATLIMGLRSAPLYLGFFAMNALEGTFVALLMSMILAVSVTTTSSYFILFAVYMLYALVLIPTAGLIASFFSNARLATLFAPIIYFVMSFLVFVGNFSGPKTFIGLSVFPPTAMCCFLTQFLKLSSSDGFHAGSFYNPYLSPKPYWYLILLGIDFGAYTVLMLYFDAVFPNSYGSPQHPLFFVKKPVRCIRHCLARRRTRKAAEERQRQQQQQQHQCQQMGFIDKDGNETALPAVLCDGKDASHSCVEPYTAQVDSSNENSQEDRYRSSSGVFDDTFQVNRRVAIELRQVVKRYRRAGETFCAVDHLSWTMNSNEISVLLGPNGAGKSTLVNIITGMTKPDEGDCIVYGHSVLKELSVVRSRIGFCPQHNILWPDLTCREHLEYFGKVKGLCGAPLEAAIDRLLATVNLQDKIDSRPSSLSGGQKRKLSVSLAFIGESNLVILDEPTAGMDVAARRSTWSLLRAMSKGCSVLLTTHFMDEADLLGDRIGIVAKGRLQCCGSSLFLKSQLGKGYTLRVELDDEAFAPRVGKIVTGVVSDAHEINRNGREVQYGIPKERMDKMSDLLREMEQEERSAQKGVRGFSVSASTLEEIFLSIAQDNDEDGGGEAPGVESLRVVWGAEKAPCACARWWLVLGSMITKRFLCSLRDYRLQFFQIIFPVLCVLLASLMGLVRYSNSTPLDISPAMYAGMSEIVVSRCESTLGVRSGVLDSASRLSWSNHNFANTSTLSYYLLDAALVHPLPRYAAIQCEDADVVSQLNAQLNQIVNGITSTVSFSLLQNVEPILYNSSSAHSAAVGLHTYFQALYEQALVPGQAPGTFRLVNNPMPDQKKSGSGSAILVAIVSIIPFLFIPGSPVSWVVMERSCRARHIQRMLGVSSFVYTLANFIFDLICFALSATLCIVIFVIFQTTAFIGKDVLGVTITDFVAYGVSSILLAYVISYFFDDYAVAQQATMLVFFITGFLLEMVVLVLTVTASGRDTGHTLGWVFRIFPSFSFAEVLLNLASTEQLRKATHASAWTMDIVGWPCVYMAIEAPVFLVILFLLENPWRRRLARALNRLLCCCLWRVSRSEEGKDGNALHIDGEDRDVVEERLAVMYMDAADVRHHHRQGKKGDHRHHEDGAEVQGQGREKKPAEQHVREEMDRQTLDLNTTEVHVEGSEEDQEGEGAASGGRPQSQDPVATVEDVVRISGLRKVYPGKKVAVRSLSFSVMPNEVFAFLGTNGAGKTTSMSILCQEQMPTRGHAYVAGYDSVSQSEKAIRSIGYCPQFDATLELLTVQEHLEVYALSLSICKRDRVGVVETLLQLCGLHGYRSVLASELSGGNRRKLNVAIALIGAPKVLCLDEPSAGMDPVTRRRMWDTITIASKYCSVLLTTHHLEEVEALADYVAIMSCGRLRCIGDLPHLKRHYGCGYEVCLHVVAAPAVAAAEGKRQKLGDTADTLPTSAPGDMKRSAAETHEPVDDDEAKLTNAVAPHRLCGTVSEEEEDDRHAARGGDPVLRFIHDHFPLARLKEKMQNERYVFTLPIGHGRGSRLSHVFETLHAVKESLHISHYSVSQATIEQIFLPFCQEEGEDMRRALRTKLQTKQQKKKRKCMPSSSAPAAQKSSHHDDNDHESNSGRHNDVSGEIRIQIKDERWKRGVSGRRRGFLIAESFN